MKQKLFSIFCCLLLSASMVTQAQKSLLALAYEQNIAQQNATEQVFGTLKGQPNRVSPRANVANVPYDQATLNVSWDWSNYRPVTNLGSVSVGSGSKKKTYYSYLIGCRDGDGNQFAFHISFTSTSSMRTITINGSSTTFPKNGTYTISTSSSKEDGRLYGGNGTSTQSSGTVMCTANIGGNTGIYFNEGEMIVKDGANGLPFVTIQANVDFSANYKRYSCYMTIGQPAVENLTETWTNAELVNSTTMINWADYGYDAEYVQRIEWYRDGVSGRRPCIRLECDMWPSDIYYNSKLLPGYGTYTLNTNGNSVNVNELWAYPISVGGEYRYTFWYPSDGVKRYLKAGTMQVVRGMDGPCLKINATGSTHEKFSNSTYNLTIGTAAYLITFKNYDGSTLQSSDFGEGSTPSYSGTPTKPDDASYTYTFSGWLPAIGKATADQVYTAQFRSSPKVTAVDVTLDPNDGTTDNEQIVSATNGSAMPLTLKAGGSIVAPTFSGYNFGGYFANNDGTGTQYYTASLTSANNFDKTEATTLYAKWTQTVTLNQNCATTNGTASVTATYNDTIGSIANNPSKTGYDFGGWYADNDASGSQIINTSGVLQSSVTNWTDANSKWIHAGASTLYAKWTQTIMLNKNGGTNDGTVTVTYNANTTTSFLAVTGIPIGYSAVKGYYDAAADGNKIFNADGTLVSYSSAVSSYLSSDGKWNHNGVAPTIYAQFTPNTNTNYTVKHWQQNLADNDYTEVTGDRQQLQGTTDDVTAAVAKTYYTGFIAQSFDQKTIAGDGSTVVNIYYNRDTYTVNLAVSPAGYGSVSPSAAITGVRYGTVITTGTGENANKVTINKTVVTANPAATTAEYTYTFDNWTNGAATVTSDTTVTANFTRTTNTYKLTWNFNGGTTTDDYINGSVEWGTPITAPTPTKDGCTFAGWDITPAATMPAATTTYTAQWTNCTISALTLEDNRDATYYNTFVDDYNGVNVVTVTYNRTFAANTWSTVCLPFYVNADNLSGAGWLGSVYEFKHAEGTANVGDGLYLNFYPAREMEAGKGYLVYSQGAALEGGFEFYDVTIDTDADTVSAITDLVGYNDGQGTITLVGTLRQGTLTPNATSQMALKDNMVWYPGSGTTTIRAYRGFFKDSSGSPIPPRVHIVVEGEVVTDLEIMDNGELRMENDNVRKYIEDGVLIVERNGIRYDAQGKLIIDN